MDAIVARQKGHEGFMANISRSDVQVDGRAISIESSTYADAFCDISDGVNIKSTRQTRSDLNFDTRIINFRKAMSLSARKNQVCMYIVQNTLTGWALNSITEFCWTWIEATPDIPVGIFTEKSSKKRNELSPVTVLDVNFPTKIRSPRSADGSGQGDVPQATIPIIRLISS